MLAVAVIVHWLLPPSLPRVRALWLIAVSVVLIAAVAPIGGLFVLGMGVYCRVAARLFEWRKHRALLALGILGTLVPMLVSRLMLEDQSMLVTLGIAFTTVKAISVVVDAYARPGSRSLTDILLFVLFFPLYTVGPVERLEKFTRDKLSMPFDVRDIAGGALRVFQGIFIGQFIADGLLRGVLESRFGDVTDSIDLMTTGEAWQFVIVRFLYSFLNFVAVSEVAIGASRMLGFRIVENFDLPLLAANIQDFWRRYHISMGFFITRYLYFPIVGVIRRRWATYVATFTAFVLFGLWHAFTWNYLLWGVGHGLAMALYHGYRQNVVDRGAVAQLRALPPFRVAATLITLLYVAWLQTFANMPDLPAAISLTGRLVAM